MFQVENPSQCLRNDHGYDYYEFSCLYPAYGATYTECVHLELILSSCS
jgi:hypothetical protein